MANSNSAKKRIRTNERNRRQNKYYKTSVKNMTKHLLSLTESLSISKESTKKEELQKKFSLLCSLLDKGTKRNVFHKNNAARQKKKFSKQLKFL